MIGDVRAFRYCGARRVYAGLQIINECVASRRGGSMRRGEGLPRSKPVFIRLLRGRANSRIRLRSWRGYFQPYPRRKRRCASRLTSSWSGPSYGVTCAPHVRHFIVHTRRAGHVVARPLNCGVRRHLMIDVRVVLSTSCRPRTGAKRIPIRRPWSSSLQRALNRRRCHTTPDDSRWIQCRVVTGRPSVRRAAARRLSRLRSRAALDHSTCDHCSNRIAAMTLCYEPRAVRTSVYGRLLAKRSLALRSSDRAPLCGGSSVIAGSDGAA